MAIAREVVVTTRLVLDDKLTAGLGKSKAAADTAAASVDKLKSAAAAAGSAPSRAATAGLTPLTAAAATAPAASLAVLAANATGDIAADRAAAMARQQNNQIQERLAKFQRVAGLAGGSLAMSGATGPAANIGAATLGGAAAGAMFGPWGAAIGAALGGIPAIVGAIGESAEKAKAAVEKLKAEASATASAIFSREAEIRRLRGGGGEVTAASLTSAAPLAAAAVAGLSPEDAMSTLRHHAAFSVPRVRTAEAAASETTTETFWSRLGGPGRIFSPRAATPEDMSTRRAELAAARLESLTLARAVAEGVAGVTRPAIAGIAGGGSGGAGFISESITGSLLSGEAAADPSVSLLEEIRGLLSGSSVGPLVTISERLMPGPA